MQVGQRSLGVRTDADLEFVRIVGLEVFKDRDGTAWAKKNRLETPNLHRQRSLTAYGPGSVTSESYSKSLKFCDTECG